MAMPTIAQVTAALKSKLDTIDGVTVYDYMPGSVASPAAVIVPGLVTEFAANRKTTIRDYRVILLVPQTAEASAQYKVYGFLDVFGATSVRSVVEADKTLGLTDVSATHMGDDGMTEITWAGTTYFGSTITVSISTQGGA